MKYMHACGFGGTLTFEFNKIVFFFFLTSTSPEE